MYVAATEEARALETSRRNERFEDIARATARATWAAAIAAVAAAIGSIIQALK